MLRQKAEKKEQDNANPHIAGNEGQILNKQQIIAEKKRRAADNKAWRMQKKLWRKQRSLEKKSKKIQEDLESKRRLATKKVKFAEKKLQRVEKKLHKIEKMKETQEAFLESILLTNPSEVEAQGEKKLIWGKKSKDKSEKKSKDKKKPKAKTKKDKKPKEKKKKEPKEKKQKEPKQKEPKEKKQKEPKVKPEKKDKDGTGGKSKKGLFLIIGGLAVAAVAGASAFFFLGGDVLDVKRAEKTVEGMFSAFHALDFDEAGKHINMNDLVLEKPYVGVGNSQIYMNGLFGHISSEIISSEMVDENRIIVTTNISAVKMKPIMADFTKKGINFIFQDAYSGNPLNDEQRVKKLEELFSESVSSLKLETVAHHVDITVARSENNGWRIVADEALINALFGGLLDTQGNFFSPDPPEEKSDDSDQEEASSGH